MQGKWKSFVHGYDRKGSRRKKNKTKYLIKDKGAAILKRVEAKKHKDVKLDPYVYREEPFNNSFEKKYVFLKYSHYTDFLYNQIFQWTEIRYERGRIKSFAKKMVNGQTRASVRDWIQRGDWEGERKTPCYEKSFAWFID